MSKQDNFYGSLSNAEKLLNYKSNMNTMIKTMNNLNHYYSATSNVLRALEQFNNVSKLGNISNRATMAINSLKPFSATSSIMKAIEQHKNLSKLGNVNNSLYQFSGAYAILKQASLLNSTYTKAFSALQSLSAQQSKIFDSVYNQITIKNDILNPQSLQSIQKVLDSHERIFSAIDKIEYNEDVEDSVEIKVEQLINTVNDENIEEQIQIINTEPDKNTRIALFSALVAVISLVAMIIFGVIAHNDSKASSINQEEIILLLNQNIKNQEQQNVLLEKTCNNKEQELSLSKQQAELIQELLSTIKALETKLSEED